MMTIPNFLSFLRFPLAFLFLVENIHVRILAILLAAGTDFLDGFIARNYEQSSVLGRIIDPLADKFFVLFLTLILLTESNLSKLEALSFFSRDFAVLCFGCFLFATSRLKGYHYKPFWCGKLTTALQFLVLLTLTLKIPVPAWVFVFFVILGVAALVELFYPKTHKKPSTI